MHRTLRALVLVAFLSGAPSHAGAAFPPGFLWGTAISGFQTEMGGLAIHNDSKSDWWVWVHDPENMTTGRVSGDLPETGPAFYDQYRRDVRRVARRRLASNPFRLSIERSRIFPTSTAGVDASGGITLDVLRQLHALANGSEGRHYRAVPRALRRAHMKPL